MRRRLGLGFAATGLGAAVLVAVLWPALAIGGAAATPRVPRLNISDTNIEYIDPALNYDFLGWRLETMTCARLLSYPDKAGAAGARLVPEVARSMPRVSDNGLTYTFRIRPGFRFSDGSPVTPGSFCVRSERALDPRMQSPAASFSSDIRGAAAVQAGKAKTPSGVKVSGDRLAITLTRPAPDFLSRISMLFFCAVPENLPIDARGVTEIRGRGRTTSRSSTSDRRSSCVATRTTAARGRSGGTRSRWPRTSACRRATCRFGGGTSTSTSRAPARRQTELTRSYGINNGRYFVLPGLTIQYIALNTARPLFRDVSMRQAVAYAIDRIGLMRLAGLNGGIPNDQLLPPGIPGYRAVTVFPNPSLARARALMRGRTAKAVLYAGNDPVSKAQSELIRTVSDGSASRSRSRRTRSASRSPRPGRAESRST